MARRKKSKKSGIIRKILFILEILVLLILLGGLYLFGQTKTKLAKIEQPVLDEGEIIVNENVKQMTGYTTYALFGIDHRDTNAELDGENSDTMIIASVNNDTQEVRLVSLYRDTFLNIGSDTYSKANAAYALGGPEQAISMLNTNLDLDISDYVTVDFKALTKAIDALGGLDIPLTYAEMVHVNSYSKEVSKETGETYTEIPLPDTEPEDIEAIYDTYHLNGVQVTSYCRIRYTASMDMGRTERQRRVIQMVAQKAKTAGLTTLFQLMDEVFPMVKTSLRSNEILSMIPSLLNYSVANTTGFPEHYKFSEVSGSIIVCTDLVTDVRALHEFLYGDADYEPSAVVQSRASRILEIVGGQEALIDEAPVVDDNSGNQNYIYQEATPTPSWDENYYNYNDDTGYDDYNDYNYNVDDGGNYDDYYQNSQEGGTDYGDTGGTEAE